MSQAAVILPSQQIKARGPLVPEQRLMIAVVQDAINCVEKYRFATDQRGRRLFAEVTQWLTASEPGWPYSFESICEVLGLDADAVRCRLGVAQEQQAAPLPRQMYAVGQESRSRWNGESIERGVTMPLINVIIVLVVVGVLLYIVEALLPIEATIKRIIHIIVVLAVCIWLLQAFGIIGSLGSFRFR
jgi:hypothetical protein